MNTKRSKVGSLIILILCGILILVGLVGLVVQGQMSLYTDTPVQTVEPSPTLKEAETVPPTPSLTPTPEPTPSETPEPVVEPVYYDCPFDTTTQDLIYRNLDAFSMDLELRHILAMVFKESGFRQTVESGAGAKGYMQMLDNTFTFAYDACIEEFPQFEGMTYDVFDTETNLTLGMWYLHHIADELGYNTVDLDNFPRVLCCYNRGISGARNYYNKYGTYETSYSKNILEVAAQLETDGGIVVYY